ncbi:hypothetical protein O0L34_g1850 [Tuta absoluta]|nr:hypothetical protein O0L34_g1850 [Tuta absoluta]
MTGKGVANGNSGACTPVASATASPLLAARSAADDNAAISPATVPAPAPPSHKSDNDDNMVHQRAHSVSSSIQGGYATVGRAPRGPLASAGANIEPPQGETTEQQLRYENDRLKLALAQRGPLASAGANIEPPQGETTEQQLRYENDRFKLS